jgi:hypothetical protein
LKIIYLFTSPSLLGSSVQTKVLNQIKYLNIAGAECRGAFFSTEVTVITPLNENVDLIPVEKCTWKYFRASGQKRNTLLTVLKYANEKFNDVGFFYFRYPGAGSILTKFILKFGNKTIFEHLSIEEMELRLHAKENPFGIRPSRLFSWLEYTFLPLWREKRYGKYIRRNALLGICNSNDIKHWQTKVSGGKYNTIIGGDGVDVNSYNLLNLPKLNHELNLVFLKGANTSAEYNGLERILEGIKAYNGDKKICLYILGRDLKYEEKLRDEIGLSPEQIILKGFINGTELENFLLKIHIGVSQFGIFKKGLNENSTIKAREYIAIGLPFIYGHIDPDLNEESKEFALEFPNDDSLIDMEKVIEFAKKALEDKALPQKMRKYAEEHLDYEVKMKKLYQELQRL